MKDWKETVLTDVTSKIGDGLHGTPKYDNEGEYYFINGNNLVDGKIIIKPETKKVSKSEFLKHQKLLSSNTILLGINGTFGNVAFYNNEKCILGKSACYINVNEKVDKKFLYYNFLNKDFQLFLESIATGTTIPNVPLKGLRDYSFILPPISEQQSIAEVLSSLDDKIDLLHRQNKTLEQMAETLFRQWFVDAPEEAPLKYFGKIVCGKTPSKKVSEYYSGEVPFVKIPDMHGNVFLFETEDSLTKIGRDSQANKTLPKYSICVSCIATVGLVSITTKECQTNQQINSIVPSKDIYRYYLYIHLKTIKDDLMSRASGGSVTMNLNTSDFSNISIPLFSDEYFSNFDSTVGIYFAKIYSNISQIRKLVEIRDSLLPKLMNGSVRVINN